MVRLQRLPDEQLLRRWDICDLDSLPLAEVVDARGPLIFVCCPFGCGRIHAHSRPRGRDSSDIRPSHCQPVRLYRLVLRLRGKLCSPSLRLIDGGVT